MISTLDWPDASNLCTEKFWVRELKYKDAADEQIFSELAMFALALSSLPFSNAAVESMFSQMNLLKTKL